MSILKLIHIKFHIIDMVSIYMDKSYVLNVKCKGKQSRWIKVVQNGIYTPRYHLEYHKNNTCNTYSNPIYIWVVADHNIYDKGDPSLELNFINPDLAHIECVDKRNNIILNEKGTLIFTHKELKHKGMKMSPLLYKARNVSQIKEALKHVKYCVVKTDVPYGKLIC
jgi:hypothetical protein